MCSICPFQRRCVRTSEIELAFFERVEVGEGILNQLGREPHRCGLRGVWGDGEMF